MMVRRSFRIGAFGVVFLGVGALVLLQQQQIKRLVAESAALRAQLNQMAALQDSNGHLTEQLKAAVDASEANKNELMRLRGQGLRLRQLEQENTQLKGQREEVGRQMREAQLAVASAKESQVTPPTAVTVATVSPRMDTTDLGTVELSDGIAARFNLGGGTNCVVTPTVLSDGNVLMQITVGVTNADGTVSELGTSRLTAPPGHHCSISVGDRMIALAAKPKSE
jgi:hypothetical protein